MRPAHKKAGDQEQGLPEKKRDEDAARTGAVPGKKPQPLKIEDRDRQEQGRRGLLLF
jgi:hypothetical protein